MWWTWIADSPQGGSRPDNSPLWSSWGSSWACCSSGRRFHMGHYSPCSRCGRDRSCGSTCWGSRLSRNQWCMCRWSAGSSRTCSWCTAHCCRRPGSRWRSAGTEYRSHTCRVWGVRRSPPDTHWGTCRGAGNCLCRCSSSWCNFTSTTRNTTCKLYRSSRRYSWWGPCNTVAGTKDSTCSRSRRSSCTAGRTARSSSHLAPGHLGKSVCTSCWLHRICCKYPCTLSRTGLTHSSTWRGLRMTSRLCSTLCRWRTPLSLCHRKYMCPLARKCQQGMHSRIWHQLHNSTAGWLVLKCMMCILWTRPCTHCKRHHIWGMLLIAHWHSSLMGMWAHMMR